MKKTIMTIAFPHFFIFLLFLCFSNEASAAKAPFTVLYNNDTTNILSCTSPYHKKGKGFTPEMLEASVAETADTGVQVHLLQPGMGWVPWWNSKIYPYSEHAAWMKEQYGIEPSPGSFAYYMSHGGDIVKVFVDSCRKNRLAPFISIRMNDGHRLEDAFLPKGSKFTSDAWHTLNKFYVTHPQYRIGTNPASWEERVLNWANPEVPEYRLNFIREICDNYDIDGIELDFMRYYSFFRVKETTSAQRKAVMCSFAAKVRKILDDTSKKGRHRWLCVRVPLRLDMHDSLGLDLAGLTQSGVEMIVASSSYFTEQQGDFSKFREMAPAAALYLEMAHSAYNYSAKNILNITYDNFYFRRVTDEQFYTAAHNAYASGFDGISMFNFAYFREHAAPELGPFNEPPFHIFRYLQSHEAVAAFPQHYFLSGGFTPAGYTRPVLPSRFRPGDTKEYKLSMHSPKNGWKTGGILRIQADSSIKETQWEAFLNNTALNPAHSPDEPYRSPYVNFFGTAEYYKAWNLSAETLKEGENIIRIKLLKGNLSAVQYIDLSAE